MTTESPRIAILSDLHLPNAPSVRTETFLRLLDAFAKPETHVDELWLLGDILDFFVGPFRFWRRLHGPIFDRLEALTKAGTKVLWLEGNHDFHVRQVLGPLGIEVFEEQIERSVAGRRVYLAHGDLVNSDDHAYLRWRRLTHNAFLRACVAALPDLAAEALLKPFAERLSRESRKRDRHEPGLADLYRNFAEARFAEGYGAVLLGHCHLDELHLNANGNFYLNVGSWISGPPRLALWEPATGQPPTPVTVSDFCPPL